MLFCDKRYDAPNIARPREDAIKQNKKKSRSISQQRWSLDTLGIIGNALSNFASFHIAKDEECPIVLHPQQISALRRNEQGSFIF